MKYLIKKILTEGRSLDKITDVLLYHDEYDDEEVESIIKLFGGDITSLYHFIDDKGRGLEFLNHLQNRVWRGGGYLVEALQIGDPTYSKEDMDLFMTWIFPMWEGGELTRKGDRILLEIVGYDQTQLFGGDSEDIAEIIFNPDEMPMELNFIRLNAEDLVDMMTEENFIGLVRYVGRHNMNEEIDTFREEFDPWVEEDGLGNRSFLLTPDRLNRFLDPSGDLESRKYNFTVLLDSSDKLSDILNEVEWVYSDSYNWVYENEYRKMYHKELEGLIGKPVGEGEKENWRASSGDKTVRDTTPTKFYDVTDLMSTILWQATKDGEDPGQSTVFELIEAHKGFLTPGEPDWPDEGDKEIVDSYNEYLEDLFGSRNIY
jgi:hypothetical protein